MQGSGKRKALHKSLRGFWFWLGLGLMAFLQAMEITRGPNWPPNFSILKAWRVGLDIFHYFPPPPPLFHKMLLTTWMGNTIRSYHPWDAKTNYLIKPILFGTKKGGGGPRGVIFTDNQLKISMIHGRRTNFERRQDSKNKSSFNPIARHEKLWPFFPSRKHSGESLTCFSDTNHRVFFHFREIKILHSKKRNYTWRGC